MTINLIDIDKLWIIDYKGTRYYVDPNLLKYVLSMINKSSYGINKDNIRIYKCVPTHFFRL